MYGMMNINNTVIIVTIKIVKGNIVLTVVFLFPPRSSPLSIKLSGVRQSKIL